MTDFTAAEATVRSSKVDDLIAIGVATLIAAGEVGREYAETQKLPLPLITYIERVDELAREYRCR